MSRSAEVRCAGISFAIKNPLLDPEGEQVVNDAGIKQFSVERGFARMGEIIELSDHEFAIHFNQGGVQDPGSAPLPGSPGHRPGPTPFSSPVPVDADGQPVSWNAPVMGDPSPAGAGLSDTELSKSGGALSPEMIAELNAKADGETEDAELTELDIDSAPSDEVAEFIIDNRLNVQDTIDLAGGDPEYAAKVLEAEQAGKDRVSVTDALQKVIDDSEENE